ncbi:MAG: hypothetical protein GOV15_01630 [Candidatus Diapherotrites archaeon]|nr:hypothetical protein [Candidatus Diapherotrites archaeon]
MSSPLITKEQLLIRSVDLLYLESVLEAMHKEAELLGVPSSMRDVNLSIESLVIKSLHHGERFQQKSTVNPATSLMASTSAYYFSQFYESAALTRLKDFFGRTFVIDGAIILGEQEARDEAYMMPLLNLNATLSKEYRSKLQAVQTTMMKAAKYFISKN